MSDSTSSVFVQRSGERFSGDHGWLRTDHSFNPDYAAPDEMHWGALHVFNDDRVAPGQGFPPHQHRDMEILTYVVDGALEHRDSMGNQGIVKRGGVQYMSAGTGVVHSEYNASATELLRFLQMWVPPRHAGLKPVYGQIDYTVADRKNRWLTVASGLGGERGDVTLDRDALLSVSRLEDARLSRKLEDWRMAFLFVAVGVVACSVKVNSGETIEVELSDGDALRVRNASNIFVEGKAEVVLWDVGDMPSIW